jgi:hypothetical protein
LLPLQQKVGEVSSYPLAESQPTHSVFPRSSTAHSEQPSIRTEHGAHKLFPAGYSSLLVLQQIVPEISNPPAVSQS